MLKHTKNCEVTGFNKPFALEACHIKPYSMCETEEEKMDPHNCICLLSNIHKAFDSGYITFDQYGNILITKLLDDEEIMRLGLTGKERIRLGGRRPDYLSWHRENIFENFI